jgi:hypothetical protein
MKRKRIEFSKIIFIGVSTITIAVVVFSFLMIYKTGDLSPLSYLIPSIFAELATATGFYYRKAEKENTKGGIVYDSVMAEQVSNGEYPEGGLTDES